MRARTQIDAGREVAELDGVNAARQRPAEVVLALQRSAGNAAVASFLGRQHHPDGGTPDGGMSIMPQVDPAGRRQAFDIPVMLTAEPVDGGTSDGGTSSAPDGGAPVCLPPPLAS